jgi:FkbH-like protein
VKLAEALSIVQRAPADVPSFSVLLACGFTPLHLQNYLTAYLQQSMPTRKVAVSTGLYEDVAGTLEHFTQSGAQSGALALEWPDLDPRLGYRHLGGWGHRVVASILENFEARLIRLEAAIQAIPSSSKLAISLPMLSLPPAFHTTGWQASRAEVVLDEFIAKFARRVVEYPSVLLVNKQTLDAESPPGTRYDFRSDLHTGFPYTLAHTDALARALAGLIKSPEPKKGLITDLDDTLWFGLVGEAGHENVSWDLANKAQLHGLYQQMLHALADQGVLIGIASKNSLDEVEQALSRSDLVIARDKIFPIEVHWDAKSASVSRILRAWNIDASSVAFVDDSPMELEEVRAAHPGIECILFPKSDSAAGLRFLRHLRDLFGKPSLSEEDAYRLESIRQNREFAQTNGAGVLAEDFLSKAEANITLEYNPSGSDRRVVELVNKTNQFNLNGIRYTETEWDRALDAPNGFVLAVSYQDKFGPLGKIAVLRGQKEGPQLRIGTWVMSCRAFSRRIEHQCLSQLFRRFAVDEMVFEFKETPKNRPIQDFLSSMSDQPATSELRLQRQVFEAKCPSLYHQLKEIDG